MENRETVPFQTETVKLLQMMIHSVYTKKEVFLRELICNASDAIDRRFALAITHPDGTFGLRNRKEYMIRITPNKPKRLLTVSDNGIGMNAEDLKKCLGTIAFSGTQSSLKEDAEKELIGRFGIGFYSLFMAADHVRVVSRKAGEEKAYVFESSGIDSYEIYEGNRSECGTDVILHIREEETEGGDEYNRYLREYTIYRLVKQYSDYIHWPIRLLMPIAVPDEKGEPTEKWSYELLNSMIPLWKRPAKEVSEEEALTFYREHFCRLSDFDNRRDAFTPPLKTLIFKIEGNVNFSALIYIPKVPWKTFDTKEDRRGLELYVNSVRIHEHMAELLPEEFPFLKGSVDCSDLPLNITRETLQASGKIEAIREAVFRKVFRALQEEMAENREDYGLFYESFGKCLRLSAMEKEGKRRTQLQRLLLFESSEGSPVTLEEYVSSMQAGQKEIYYAFGASRKEIFQLAETEKAQKLKIPFLFAKDLTEDLCFRIFEAYREIPIVSLSDTKAEIFRAAASPFSEEEEKALLRFIRETLKEEVDEAVSSGRLETHPVLLSNGPISFEMEESYRRLYPGKTIKGKRILELNLSHPALAAVNRARSADREKAKLYVRILYTQACLQAGLEIEDMAEYTDQVVSLFV